MKIQRLSQALVFALGCVGLQTPGSSATVSEALSALRDVRSLTVKFDGVRTSSVLVDTVAGRLLICEGVLAESCKEYSIPGVVDVVSARHPEQERAALIRMDGSGHLTACRPDTAGRLDCSEPVENYVKRLQVGAVNVTQVGRVGESFTCTSGLVTSPRCSSAQSLVDISEAIYFARFRPNDDVRGLLVRNGVTYLCAARVSPVCRPVRGLDEIGSRSALVHSTQSSIDGTAIVVVQPDRIGSCGLESSSERPHFSCSWMSATTDSATQLRVVSGRTAKGRVRDTLVGLLDHSEAAQASADASKRTHEPTPVRGRADPLARAINDLDLRAKRDRLFRSTPLTDSVYLDGDSDGYLRPAFWVPAERSEAILAQYWNEEWEDDTSYYSAHWSYDAPGFAADWEIWTESIGYWRWAWNANKTPACAACDAQLQIDGDRCEMTAGFLSDAVGTSLPLVGAFTFIFSGGNLPIAGVVTLGVLGAGNEVIQNRLTSCKAAALVDAYNCRTRNCN